MNLRYHDRLEIRPVDESTQEAARNLILAGLVEHFGWLDETLNPDLDQIIKTYIKNGDQFIVGLIEEEVVCTGALIEEDPQTGRIGRMSVDPAYRRQGLATLILHYLCNLARQAGYTRLLVETNRDWAGAIRLYEKFGFVEYKRDAKEVHLNMNLF